MEKLVRYLDPHEAASLSEALARDLGSPEVAVVKNLDYVYAPVELYALAPRVTSALDRVAAFAVDMDGTSTTTEPLALHSLEYMVRRFTGRLSTSDWPGLDHEKDYPYVIGNSNFRHTEFLVERYKENLDLDALRQSFFEALLWTLANMRDPQRIEDVKTNAANVGVGAVLRDPDFQAAVSREVGESDLAELARPFVARYGAAFRADNDSALVSAALDVYYTRYHSILRQVEGGSGDRLSRELLGEEGRRLIEPMPGYAVFIGLVKGWLAGDAAGLCGLLREVPSDEDRARLDRLARRFSDSPARVGLVTASIAYEAHAVIEEVFRVMREQIAEWPVSTAKKRELIDRFADYREVYDAFVTASDSSEARLKPHRDLYSIALYQMSIPRTDYCRCVGLEDTEPGIVSLRAAGVGCAVALPNRDTSRQDYQAASAVVSGGLPCFILDHNAMLD